MSSQTHFHYEMEMSDVSTCFEEVVYYANITEHLLVCKALCQVL